MRSISNCRFKIAMVVARMLICVAAVPQAFAQESFPTIRTNELKSMLDKKDKFTLIDSRTKPEYAEQSGSCKTGPVHKRGRVSIRPLRRIRI